MQMKAYPIDSTRPNPRSLRWSRRWRYVDWVYNETLAMRKDAWENEQKQVSCYESKRQIPLWKKNVLNSPRSILRSCRMSRYALILPSKPSSGG